MKRIGPPPRSSVIAGALVLVVVSIGTYFAFTKSNPLADPFELRAAFRNANDVRSGSPVRIAGVKVGVVRKVEALDDTGEGSLVTMHIDEAGLPIGRGARAKIRPRIFLEGNYFVDLKPGPPSAPAMKDREMIPVTNTAAPVQFGQLLTALQSDTRKDLQTVFQEYGRAVSGEGGKGFNRSIQYWVPAFRDSAISNTATRGIAVHDLSTYLYSVGKVTAALDRDRSALRGLITDFATTAGALASEEARLTEAIEELPPFLRKGHRALGSLDDAFPRLRRLVVDLRPAVRSSEPNLRAGLPFARQMRALFSRPELRGLVADLRPTVPALARFNKGGVALQGQLRALGSCQNNVIIPTLTSTIPDDNFKPTGKVYEEGVKWLPGIAGESRSFDANGQYIKSLAYSANYAYPLNDGKLFFTQAPLQGVKPPRNDQPPLRPDVPCETQEPPDLRSGNGALPAATTVNHSTAAGQARRAVIRGEVAKYLEDTVKAQGLDDTFTVLTRELNAGELGQLLGSAP